MYKKRRCPECRKEIHKEAHLSRIYCCDTCRDIANRHAGYIRKKATEVERRCTVCGELLNFTRRKKYCKECYSRFRRIYDNKRVKRMNDNIKGLVKERKEYLKTLDDNSFFEEVAKKIMKEIDDEKVGQITQPSAGANALP